MPPRGFISGLYAAVYGARTAGFHGRRRWHPADGPRRRRRDARGHSIKEDPVTTILIGVDGSARSEDAVAFGRRLAGATSGRVVVGCAFPYSDAPSRCGKPQLPRGAEDR